MKYTVSWITKPFAILCLASSVLAQPVAAANEPSQAATTVPIDIKHTVKVSRTVTPEILGKSLFVEVVKSPKLSKALGDRLSAIGYKVVANEGEADLKLKYYGFVFVGKAGGGSEARAQFYEVIDQGGAIDDSKVGGYASSSLAGAALTGASMNAFGASLSTIVTQSGILNWLSAQSGIAGAFNKALTGDPRGVCLSKDCESIRTRTTIALQSFGSVDVRPGWMVETIAISDKLVTDQVIIAALEAALRPFEDAARQAGATAK